MIDVVIVNWNAGRFLKACIDSLVQHGPKIINSIVVVDNGSTDSSLISIEDNCEVILVRAGINLGFGKACNLGAYQCNSEYLLFLNPDAALHPNTLQEALSYMQNAANDGVGICGVQLLDESGRVARTCARFPSVRLFAAQAFGLSKFRMLNGWSHRMSEWDHASTRDVDHVIGAFYLIRKSLFESLGGFDERFFVYLEDLDLSLRARQAGWRSVYLATATAFHAGGGTSKQVKAARLFYSLRSRLLYGFKHFSELRAWALVGVTLLVEPISRLGFSAVCGGREDLLNTLRAYGMLWRALPSILKGRPR